MLFCGFHIGGGFFLTSCVQRQCGCLSCLTPERRVVQKKGCSRQDGKILLAEWRFFRIDANVPLPHVYFGKRLQQSPTRLRYASDENGLPDIQESHRTTLKSKMPDFTERHHIEKSGETRKWQKEKRKESAIPEQDNDRHLFKPESSAGAGQMTVFIPVD